MAKTLYVHIGTPKTGTTSLQRFCMDNCAALEARGCAYPVMPVKYPSVGPARNGCFLTVATRGRTAEEVEENRHKLAAAFETVRAAFEGHDTAIVSDEGLWSAISEHLEVFWEPLREHAAACGYDVKIIVYLRRQDQLSLSRYNQVVKAAEAGIAALTWEEWIGGRGAARIDYHGTLERIAAQVGRENIIVRVYDRGRIERESGNIYADFLGCLGLELGDDFTLPKRDQNAETLAPNLLAIQRVVNGLAGYDRERDILFRRSALACSARSKAPKASLLSAEETRALLARYEEDNERIAHEYLHRPGPLFDTAVADVPKWTPDNPWMADDVAGYFREVAERQEKAAKTGSTAAAAVTEAEEGAPAPARPAFEAWLVRCAAEDTEHLPAFECVAGCLGSFFLARNHAAADGCVLAPLDGEAAERLARALLAAAESVASCGAGADAAAGSVAALDALFDAEIARCSENAAAKAEHARKQAELKTARAERDTARGRLEKARAENKALRGELKATQRELKAALRRTPAGLARRAAGALRHPSRIVRKLRALLGRRNASAPSTRS